MRKNLLFLMVLSLLLIFISPALAQYYGQDQSIRGHTRQNGTYVQPYHRTVPDHDPFNNYGTRGNVNPWTGERGTVDPYKQPAQPLGNPYGTQQQRRTWP
jgi:hypothetical protein